MELGWWVRGMWVSRLSRKTPRTFLDQRFLPFQLLEIHSTDVLHDTEVFEKGSGHLLTYHLCVYDGGGQSWGWPRQRAWQAARCWPCTN